MRRHRLRNRLALGACLACPRRASSGHGSVDQKKREAPGLLPHRLRQAGYAGTGWTRPVTRGSGVCRVFADRRLGGTLNAV